EKDRNRRYETANAFAADVERYLHDEQVLACPPSSWYRVRKFSRRNRAALTVAGLLLFFFSLLVGGVGWVVRGQMARRAKAAAALELTLDRAEVFQEQGKHADAAASLERVQMLANESGPDFARDQRISALRERLAAETLDQDFVHWFEKIRLQV